MGVSWVLNYQFADNMTPYQAVQRLESHVLSLGAEKLGTFSIESEIYLPQVEIIGGAKLNSFHLTHHSEFPESTFSLIGENPGSQPYIVSDRMFDQFVQKTSGVYSPRPNSKIEFNGQKYRVADFFIRFGTVSIGTNTKGVLFEFEIGFTNSAVQVFDMMKEFHQGFFGSTVSLSLAPSLDRKLRASNQSAFQPIDMINQYQDHFNALRKALLNAGTATPAQTPSHAVNAAAAAATSTTTVSQTAYQQPSTVYAAAPQQFNR